jgi:hypothetical protein
VLFLAIKILIIIYKINPTKYQANLFFYFNNNLTRRIIILIKLLFKNGIYKIIVKMVFQLDTKMNFDMNNLKENILQEALKQIEESTNKELQRKGLYQKVMKAKIVRGTVEVRSISTIDAKDQIIIDNIVRGIR